MIVRAAFDQPARGLVVWPYSSCGANSPVESPASPEETTSGNSKARAGKIEPPDLDPIRQHQAESSFNARRIGTAISHRNASVIWTAIRSVVGPVVTLV
jgi:hypothetical protein